jgi:O-antigen/teichoic acid export membrane protein
VSLRVQAAKNVSATWLGLLVHAGAGFALSPFILHKLGDEAFSLWVLVFSLTGYYGVLDLGIRSSIVRYVARFSATGDVNALAKLLSTSIAFYIVVSLVVLLLTGVGFFHLQSIFTIPPVLLESSRVLFVLAGAGVALCFPLGVFAALLEGLQKFTWLHLSQVGVTLLRALLIAIALMRGKGLVAIGVITIAMTFVGYLIIMWLAFRAFPLRFSSRYVDSKSFWQMLSYSAFVFMILLAEKLRFQTGPILVGAMISSSAVAYFAIVSKLVEYSTSVVRSMAIVFTPMSSHLHATGDVVRLRQTLVLGNRACALVTFPLCAIFVVLGRSVIEVWMGANYISSYVILVILSVPRTLYLAQSTSTKILLGMGRHRTLATVLLLEGGINIVLSILLSRHFGIAGVALGTAIPLTVTSVLFLPRHVCRELDISLHTFITQAYVLPLTLCVPLVAVLLFMRTEFPAHHYGPLVIQVASGGLFYLGGLALALLAPKRPAGTKPWEALIMGGDKRWNELPRQEKS